MRSKFFIRNLQSVNLLESFFISAVAAILIIRFSLAYYGYPQLNPGGLHIAHMLWGGLLMLVSLVFLLSYLDEPLKSLSAIVGGVGFGTFIDELGKFLTHNNNYFFKPTIALLYVIFVLLYFGFRYLQRRSVVTQEEYVANAMEYLKEASIHGLHPQEKQQALDFLSKSSSPLAAQISAVFNNLPIIEPTEKGWHHFYKALRSKLHEAYSWLISRHWFVDAVVGIFTFASLYYLLTGLFTVYKLLPEFPVFPLLRVASSIASFVFVVKGISAIRNSRLQAFRYFERALIISLFLTQFFSFYVVQLSALLELCVNIATLYIIRYAIAEEQLGEKVTTQ